MFYRPNVLSIMRKNTLEINIKTKIKTPKNMYTAYLSYRTVRSADLPILNSKHLLNMIILY